MQSKIDINMGTGKENVISRPLVSIVLPVYNGSRYLDQSIESCLSQTYLNWELVIVDDASTDSTPAIINRHINTDSRIQSIRHEANRKMTVALNTGFSQAKGDYLTYTSDDNCFRPQALEVMVDFLESHPEFDIVYCDFTTIDAEGRPLNNISVQQPEKVFKGNIHGACFLFRRAVFEKLGGYNEEFMLAQDYDFWLRASIYFRSQPLHQDLFLFRVHANAQSSSKYGSLLQEHEKAQRCNFPEMGWLSNKQRADGFLNITKMYWKNGNTASARRTTLSAMWHSPACAFREPRLLIRVLLGRKCINALKSVRNSLVKT